VTRSKRIRKNFDTFCTRHSMALLEYDERAALYLDAVGAAVVAAENPRPQPSVGELIRPPAETRLDRIPALADYLHRVKRMKPVDPIGAAKETAEPGDILKRRLIMGFDMGSTGSKAVTLDLDTQELVWEGYLSTNGNPVGAAQSLMQQFVDSEAAMHDVVAFGATGSGREIVGSLLSTCYGVDKVYILNEIAAHAEGALHFDSRVDTIFEIGGQDAKYIRLADGRVIDAAMNEACSAGTGSFIEEQGRKFKGIRDVVHLGQEGAQAQSGVSLGQHCSVFMAEIIDEAVAAGVETRAIIAGIYDSIIQNYLNRVKGNRSVGDVIFCQGMPFSADALAAAVARQTGSEVIIPPNPGTVGALGISLLARKHLDTRAAETLQPADPQKFLGAEIILKDTFICKSTKGCGGAGNRCRIDRITTRVEGKKQRFMWGGGCSMWDRGTGKHKLPDRSPDPFKEREALIDEIIAVLRKQEAQFDGGRAETKTIAITDEFHLKGLFPFFATFLHEMGFSLDIQRGADQALLKRGIEEANVPFCAPMQQFHGLVAAMAEKNPDYVFVPMLRNLPAAKDERHTKLCPIVQGSADMLRWDLGPDDAVEILSPVIDFGKGNLESKAFIKSCQNLAGQLGVYTVKWWKAYEKAVAVQSRFDTQTQEIGRRALAFCETQAVTPVVVLGRAYTIYNKVLNSNVPSILREQGALAIPVDCYPVEGAVPVFNDMYWGYGQRNLRAVHQIRRTAGIYSIWCSNYSCGPDSFNLHFYAYQMDGKPFAVIETDGHSGDAGTKTRVEAFLHCVREDLAGPTREVAPNTLKRMERDTRSLTQIAQNNECVLVPRMGQGAEVLAACLRGVGIEAESLPMPTRQTLQIGRRYTSGKECVPMTITTGSLVERLQNEMDPDKKFAFLMPKANGPCRFGCYNILHKIIMERLGWRERVRVWSPADSGYFEGTPPGLAALIFSGFVAGDMLLNAYYDARVTEITPGAAREIYERYHHALLQMAEVAATGNLTVANTLFQVTNGRMFGFASLLRKAAAELQQIKSGEDVPTVAVVGEIYVRCDPFANDFVIDRLSERKVRALFAPFIEWLEYTDHLNHTDGTASGFGDQVNSIVQKRLQTLGYSIVATEMGWPSATTVKDSLRASKPYMRDALTGEAVLTIGGPVHEWRHGEIDGVISVGPLECMPNKISEAQFFHVTETEGLPTLTISLNGDPVDPEVLDSFAFEIVESHRKSRRPRQSRRSRPTRRRRLGLRPPFLRAGRSRTRNGHV
jgi:predicted CoA-substrate-specific enzyme activase